MDEAGNVIGEYHASLACFSLVHALVKKYNPVHASDLFRPDKVNEVLAPVYDHCQPWEKMGLLMFLNDESEFDQSDIPALDEAIRNYSFGHDGPKKHLVFMRELLGKHTTVKTKYMDSTMALTVTSA